MGLPTAVEAMRKRPEMYLQPVTFDGVVAFLIGYDAALSFRFLNGFREWLIVRTDHRTNLGWPGIISNLLGATPASKEIVEELFCLLEEFIEARDAREGLRRIYFEYEHWLKSKKWYIPGSPEWLFAEVPTRRLSNKSNRSTGRMHGRSNVKRRH